MKLWPWIYSLKRYSLNWLSLRSQCPHSGREYSYRCCVNTKQSIQVVAWGSKEHMALTEINSWDFKSVFLYLYPPTMLPDPRWPPNKDYPRTPSCRNSTGISVMPITLPLKIHNLMHVSQHQVKRVSRHLGYGCIILAIYEPSISQYLLRARPKPLIQALCFRFGMC